MENFVPRKISPWQVATLFLIIIVIFMAFFDIKISPWWQSGNAADKEKTNASDEADEDEISIVDLSVQVLPQEGLELPIKWGDFGKQLIEKGVINKTRFELLYAQRGGLTEEQQKLLNGDDNETIRITSDNSGFLLNLFWAFGLANKNAVLETGPMQDRQYGGAGEFASTGGWTLSQGDAMKHYSKHEFVELAEGQQTLLENVSKNIYRPCCDNSTYFPDCNHGMAMLGFLEIMASQGASEAEMYDSALKLNSYWFPSTYVTIAKLMNERGTQWKDVSAKEVLGLQYSSSSGFQRVKNEIEPAAVQGGGGCSV